MTEPTRAQTGGAWGENARAAMVIRVLVVLVPLALAFVATWQIARQWPAPESAMAAIGRFIVLALVATIVASTTDHVARKFLPLAALFRLSLVFPDEAPSRFAIALHSNNTKKLERRLAELDSEGFHGTETEAAHLIVQLTASLSQHDRLTRGHSERVRAFAALIGEEMGLSPEDNNKLQWAALIHDVGKLRVPHEILTKPERLTDEEFEIIKTHPAEGMRLAAPLAGFLGPWVDAVGQHHERVDGGGYPNGLVGNQISLGARIVAVADTYDVITAARSYKPPQSPAYAREELARCAGSQFDAEVVRAFLNVGIGRVRRTMWPLSWALQLPFIGTAVTAPVAQTVAATVVTLATATGVASMDGGFDAVVDAPAAVAFVETFSDGDDSGAGEFAAPVVEGGTDPSDAEQSVVGGAIEGETEPRTSTSELPRNPDEEPTSDSTTTTLVAPDGATTIDPPTTSGASLPTTTTAPEAGQTTSTTTRAGGQTTTTQAAGPTTTASTTSAPTTLTTTTTSTTAAPTTTTTTTQTLDDCGRAAAGDLNLAGADLSNCDLAGAVLAGADLQGVNLAGAVLTDADLRGALIVNANLSGADLTDVKLDDAVVSNTNLSYVNATRLNAKRATFSNASFDYAKLDLAKFWQASFTSTTFSFAHAESQPVDFSGAGFAFGSMTSSRFPDAFLGSATFTDWNIIDATLTDAWMREAQTSGSLIVSGTDLGGSDWRWANLSGLYMAAGDFTGASFRDAVNEPFNPESAALTGARCPNNTFANGSPPDCW